MDLPAAPTHLHPRPPPLNFSSPSFPPSSTLLTGDGRPSPLYAEGDSSSHSSYHHHHPASQPSSPVFRIAAPDAVAYAVGDCLPSPTFPLTPPSPPIGALEHDTTPVASGSTFSLSSTTFHHVAPPSTCVPNPRDVLRAATSPYPYQSVSVSSAHSTRLSPLPERQAVNELQLDASREVISRFYQVASVHPATASLGSPSTQRAQFTLLTSSAVHARRSLTSALVHGEGYKDAYNPLHQLASVTPLVLGPPCYHHTTAPSSSSPYTCTSNDGLCRGACDGDEQRGGYHMEGEGPLGLKREGEDPMNVHVAEEEKDREGMLHSDGGEGEGGMEVAVKLEGCEAGMQGDEFCYEAIPSLEPVDPPFPYPGFAHPSAGLFASPFPSLNGFLPSSFAISSYEPVQSPLPQHMSAQEEDTSTDSTREAVREAAEGHLPLEQRGRLAAVKVSNGGAVLAKVVEMEPALSAAPVRRSLRNRRPARRAKTEDAAAPHPPTSQPLSSDGDVPPAVAGSAVSATSTIPYAFPVLPAAFDPRPTHNSTKPKRFWCKDCGKGFTQKGGLLNHERIHRGERPYHCMHRGCTRSFVQKCNLTRHERVHSGEKPYQCPVRECGKQFNRKHGLAQHLQSMHHKRPALLDMPSPSNSTTTSTEGDESRSTQEDSRMEGEDWKREELREQPGESQHAATQSVFASIPHFPVLDPRQQAPLFTRRQSPRLHSQ